MATEKSKKFSQRDDSDLPLWERICIILVWCAGAAYMCYTVAVYSQERVHHLDPQYFSRRWSFVERLRDTSNFELEYWRQWHQRALKWYLGHVVISQLLRWKFYEFRYIFNIVYSMALLILYLDWKGTLLVFGHMAFAYIAALTGSLFVVWTTVILLLSTLNVNYTIEWMNRMCEQNFVMLVFIISMVNLRYISFGAEWCDYRKRNAKTLESKDTVNDVHRVNAVQEPKEKLEFSFIRMVHYCTYFPLCLTGPVFTYNQFYAQYWQPVKPWTRQAVFVILKQTTRVVFAFIICELMLHSMYFCAIQMHPSEMQTMPIWPLGGTGYLQGQFFMVKYVLLYGVPRILCMLDQMIIPDTPSCISRIGSSVEYWRTFDRGLHQFMVRHLYMPLGGSRHGIFWQFVASTTCFIFVYIWHGAEESMFYWILGNYIDIVLETFCCVIYASPKVQELEKKYVSRANSRRLKGLLKTPSFLLTCLSVFTFLGGMDAGRAFVQRFIYEATPMKIIVSYVLGYCLVQTDYIVTVIERRRAREKSKKMQ